ncbi:MAG: aminotransferase class I/II-fold pyridoxal phosphate-dependent enzyme [Anaeromyxobacter sp.]
MLITSGVSGGLMLAIQAVIDPGDEAIFLDPYFVMYKHLLTLAGGKPVTVDSYPDFRFHADRVEAAITPRTKLLILNSPSNPTGIVMTEDEVQSAVELAKKHDLLILSDEIYEPFLYGTHRKDARPRIYDRTIVLRGFSKSHAMTGWRLGYAFGPAEIIGQMTKLQQYTFVCAPSPFQHAALAAHRRADGRLRRRVPEEARHGVRDAQQEVRGRRSLTARSTSSPRPPPATTATRVRRQGDREQRPDHPRQRVQRARHALPHQLRDHRRKAGKGVRGAVRPRVMRGGIL